MVCVGSSVDTPWSSDVFFWQNLVYVCLALEVGIKTLYYRSQPPCSISFPLLIHYYFLTRKSAAPSFFATTQSNGGRASEYILLSAEPSRAEPGRLKFFEQGEQILSGSRFGVTGRSRA